MQKSAPKTNRNISGLTLLRLKSLETVIKWFKYRKRHLILTDSETIYLKQVLQ